MPIKRMPRRSLHIMPKANCMVNAQNQSTLNMDHTPYLMQFLEKYSRRRRGRISHRKTLSWCKTGLSFKKFRK